MSQTSLPTPHLHGARWPAYLHTNTTFVACLLQASDQLSSSHTPNAALGEEVHPVSGSCACGSYAHGQLIWPRTPVDGQRLAALEELPARGL